MAEPPSAKRDLATAAVLLLVSGIGGWSLLTDPSITDADYGGDPGPGLLPGMLLALLATCSVALAVSAAVRLVRAPARAAAPPRAPAWRRHLVPALLVASLVAYTESMTALGFLETTAAFALLWTVLLGVQDGGGIGPRRVLLYAVEGVAITAGVYIVFARFIHVPLP